MVETKELILKLKEVREEKGLSLNEIVAMVEKNGDFVSRSSIQRVFSDGSETLSFRYEETIRPIAKALLDIETIEEGDNMDIQAMKTLLKYKIQRIEELERQIEALEAKLDKEKIKYHEKMDRERAQWGRSIEFLKEQISYKDQRMDLLLQAVKDKDERYDQILQLIISCPARKGETCG